MALDPQAEAVIDLVVTSRRPPYQARGPAPKFPAAIDAAGTDQWGADGYLLAAPRAVSHIAASLRQARR